VPQTIGFICFMAVSVFFEVDPIDKRVTTRFVPWNRENESFIGLTPGDHCLCAEHPHRNDRLVGRSLSAQRPHDNILLRPSQADGVK